MFCSRCGNQVQEGAQFCSACGNSFAQANVEVNNQAVNAGHTVHDIPKCTCCGNVAPWKVGPILRPIDFVIGIPLLLFGVIPGLIYIGTVAVIRLDEKNREKICTKCNARNMFTNTY